MKSKLLAARVNAWQDFKIRKIATDRELPLGFILSEAIQIYSISQYPQSKIQDWLKEYQEQNEVD